MSGKRYRKWDGVNITLAVSVGLFLLFMLSPVLDALLHPGQHERARIVSCQSNMKQLGLALTQYAQDNDESLPSYRTADGHGWREAIYPFVKSTGVYHCPDDRRDGSHDAPDDLPKSYAANHLGPNKRGQEQGAFAAVGEAPVLLTQFTQPGETIFLCDARAADASEWNMVSPAFLPNTGRELYEHVPPHTFYEHPGGTLNCLFADGHVKRLKPMATLAPVNLWTRDNAPFTGQDLGNARTILKHAESE